MEKISNYIFSKNTLLSLTSFILGTYIILYKYNDKRYLYLFSLFIVVFMYLWEDKEKYIWFLIFLHLTLAMLIMENIVVYITDGKAISYNSINMFNKIPYWLPIAYWNNILFIVYHYHLYKIFTKIDF